MRELTITFGEHVTERVHLCVERGDVEYLLIGIYAAQMGIPAVGYVRGMGFCLWGFA